MSSHAVTAHVRSPRARAAHVAAESILTIVAALTYFGIRHLSRSDPGVALRHESWLRTAEEHLGIHREAWLQRQVLPHPALVTFFDDFYIYGHWPVIAIALGWLMWHHPAEFRIARNAMIASGGVALVVFAAFPVAPPRLADPSIVDTVTLHSNAYRILQPPAFTNAYAAMPSLHCGWDLIVALCVGRVAVHSVTRMAMMLLPATMVAAVIITGNHYIVDAVAGDLLALSALALTRSLARRSATPATQSKTQSGRPRTRPMVGRGLTTREIG